MTIFHYLRDFDAAADVLNDGMSKAVAGLAGGLVAIGAASVVLCEGATDLSRTHALGFQVRRFQAGSGLMAFIQSDVRANDLVILHAMFHTSLPPIARLLRSRGVKYINAPADPYHPAVFHKRALKKFIYWHLRERPMLNRALAVQVLDARHGEFLRARGVNVPVVEVVNGFASADVPDESTLHWNPQGAVKILFLGRIDRQNKGLDLLIEAFSRIAIRDRNLTLTMQGPEHGEGDALRYHARRMGVADQVHLLAADYRKRPGEIAAEYDLFVLPSRFEGFGLSAMEAMLAARPVVISDIAGLSPHVRAARCGVVVDSTTDSIASGLQQLLQQRDQWQEMGLRGRRYVLENLNWNSIARRALTQYRALMNV